MSEDIRVVRAGLWDALLDGAELRRVGLGAYEVIRRMGFAVRDHHWGTVPPDLTPTTIEVDDDSFQAQFTARFTEDDLRMTATITIEGMSDGRLTYRFEGTADDAFDYNRIGLVILHPPSLAGSRVRLANESSGIEHLAAWPELVEPQWFVDGGPRGMWVPFTMMELQLRYGGLVRHEFSGDRFEIEDQRNWGDGSYKTYSTPLTGPRPRRLAKGEKLTQTLVVTPEGPVADTRLELGEDPTLVVFSEVAVERLPRIGFTVGPEPSPDQVERLRDQIRVDHVRTTEAAWSAVAPVARAFNTDVELVSTGRPDIASDGRPGIARHLVVGETGEALSSAQLVDIPGSSRSNPPVLIATTGPFASLNRQRPLYEFGGVAFPHAPQYHDTDDYALADSLDAIPAMVETARRLGGGSRIAVGPITLRPVPPYPGPEPGTPSSPPDPRQDTGTGLSWTVATLAALAEAGVDATTWGDLTGPSGLLDRSPSGDLVARPAFWLFQQLRDLADASVLPVWLSLSGRVAALGLIQENRVQVFVANLTSTPQPVEVRLPWELALNAMTTWAEDGSPRDEPTPADNLSRWKETLGPNAGIHFDGQLAPPIRVKRQA